MEATATNGNDKKSYWAIVELMGHVRLGGLLSEVEQFGVKMGRLDIPLPASKDCPACKGSGSTGDFAFDDDLASCTMADCCRFMTKFISGGSVYCITPVSERVARHVARSGNPEPVHSWEFPRPALPAATSAQDDDEDDRDDGYDDDVR